jgi:ubiquinone/menaquinone biosynthesis C-methylase UbiE
MKQYSKDKAEAFYNHYFDGEQYDVFRGDVGSFCTRRIIMNYVRNKQGNLLEVGTGFSSLMEDAQQFNCFCIDFSASTIAMVQEVFSRKGLQADMRVANAEALPFEDSFFDSIVSSHTWSM